MSPDKRPHFTAATRAQCTLGLQTTPPFGDVFSCIKGCVRRDADDLSLTGMSPCNNKTNVSKDVRITCFRTVTGHSAQKNGKYSSGPSQNYYILLHFAH